MTSPQPAFGDRRPADATGQLRHLRPAPAGKQLTAIALRATECGLRPLFAFALIPAASCATGKFHRYTR